MQMTNIFTENETSQYLSPTPPSTSCIPTHKTFIKQFYISHEWNRSYDFKNWMHFKCLYSQEPDIISILHEEAHLR